MATFLELCNKVRQEAGISGSGPSAVTGQTGQLKKVVDWTSRAWVSIQESRDDWRFLFLDIDFDTEAARAVYERDQIPGHTATPLKRFVGKKVLAYPASESISQSRYVQYLSYQDYKHLYLTQPETGRPRVWTIKPNGDALFYPTPNGVYTVAGMEGYALPQVLAANDDVPDIDANHHDVIVYRALMMFAGHEEAQAIYSDASREFQTRMSAMERDYLPPIAASPESPLT